MSEEIKAQTSARQAAKITKRNLKKVKAKKDGKVKLLIKNGYVTFKTKELRTQFINNILEDSMKFNAKFKRESFYYKEVD